MTNYVCMFIGREVNSIKFVHSTHKCSFYSLKIFFAKWMISHVRLFIWKTLNKKGINMTLKSLMSFKIVKVFNVFYCIISRFIVSTLVIGTIYLYDIVCLGLRFHHLFVRTWLCNWDLRLLLTISYFYRACDNDNWFLFLMRSEKWLQNYVCHINFK